MLEVLTILMIFCAAVCLMSTISCILLLWIIMKLYTEIMKILNFNKKKPEDIKP